MVASNLVKITENINIDPTKLTFLELGDTLELIVDGVFLWFDSKDYDIKELYNLISSKVVKNG